MTPPERERLIREVGFDRRGMSAFSSSPNSSTKSGVTRMARKLATSAATGSKAEMTTLCLPHADCKVTFRLPRSLAIDIAK